MQQSVQSVLTVLATALTHHCSSRCSTSLQSAQSITRPMFLDPGSSSCVLDHLQSPPSSKTKFWWHVFPFRLLASRAEVLAAAGPVVRSGSVVDRLGNGLRTQQRPHTVAGNVRVGSGRQDTSPSTRVPCTRSTLEPTFTQEYRLQPEGYKGEGATKSNHPSDVLLLYYDDVSSGPCPRAHWYMLTHW